MSSQEIKIKYPRIEKIRNWYGKYERPISSISLVGGFVFDAVTLKRVDLFWENFWVVAHLIIVAVCIVLVHAIEKTEGDEANPSKTHFWLVNILQFFFGGILSTYLVFYFRSSDIAVSWPCLVILALANEALKRHFVRLVFQVSLFFLSVFSFAIFLVPVVLHSMGDGMFLLSGVFSLVTIGTFLAIIKYFNKKEFVASRKWLYTSTLGIFLLVNVLYFTNLIPPIPLSLKDAGVYHSLKVISPGNYLLSGEQQSWQKFITLYQDYHKAPGEPVYIYSAIFSPSQLNASIIHEWQTLDSKTGKWVTKDRINLTIIGGRDGGFRTYSQKYSLTEGKWRVNVLTTRGQLIGRVRFNVIFVDSKPLTVEEKNY